MPSVSRTLLLITVAALFTLVGCGGGQPSSVTGKVQLDGKPLETGTVTFHPVGEGPMVYGQIGSGGNYEVRTGSTEGLPPGEYIITIAATGPPPPDYKPPELLTPPQYGDKTTSGLKRTVEPGKNVFDFELLSGK